MRGYVTMAVILQPVLILHRYKLIESKDFRLRRIYF